MVKMSVYVMVPVPQKAIITQVKNIKVAAHPQRKSVNISSCLQQVIVKMVFLITQFMAAIGLRAQFLEIIIDHTRSFSGIHEYMLK